MPHSPVESAFIKSHCGFLIVYGHRTSNAPFRVKSDHFFKEKETEDRVAVCLYIGSDYEGQALAPGIELLPVSLESTVNRH